MSEDAYVDPLLAGQELLNFILGNEETEGDLRVLAARIDKFVYSLRFLLVDSVASIQGTDEDSPRNGDDELRTIIGPRFPRLGFYWVVLDSNMDVASEGKIAAGDAIDDLIDIAKELTDAHWFLKHYGRNEAMAALRWRYENHLCIHVIPLRAHLEELIMPFLSRE